MEGIYIPFGIFPSRKYKNVRAAGRHVGLEPIRRLERAIEKLETARQNRVACRQEPACAEVRSGKADLWKRVLHWTAGFVRSDYFEPLFADDTRIILYQGVWGHTEPRKGIDCLSRVVLEDTGELRYEAGTKWGQVKELALGRATPKLELGYLRALEFHLSSGRVYTLIARQLEDRARLYTR